MKLNRVDFHPLMPWLEWRLE